MKVVIGTMLVAVATFASAPELAMSGGNPRGQADSQLAPDGLDAQTCADAALAAAATAKADLRSHLGAADATRPLLLQFHSRLLNIDTGGCSAPFQWAFGQFAAAAGNLARSADNLSPTDRRRLDEVLKPFELGDPFNNEPRTAIESIGGHWKYVMHEASVR